MSKPGDAARVVGETFKILASNPTVEHTWMSAQLLKLARSMGIAVADMDCDAALKTLGLWSDA